MANLKYRPVLSGEMAKSMSSPMSSTQGIKYRDSINPLKIPHYLYFLGSQQVTTDGGAVSAWGDAGLSTLDPVRTLAQGTANLQPAHDTSDEHLRFDTTTGEKDKLAFSVAVGQAGVLVVATSNGIFAYEVDADSVAEITALGPLGGTYYQALDLYAYILVPTTTSDATINGIIDWFDFYTNATKNPVGSLSEYFRARGDIVSFKMDAIDFSGVTSFTYAFPLMGSLTSFPQINTSGVTNWFYAFLNNTGLTSFPVLDTSNGTTFTYAWYQCSGLTSFPTLDFSSATSVSNTWRSCIGLTSFPVLDFPIATDLSTSWFGCTGLTSFSLCTFSTDASDNINFSNAWYGCTGLTSFPALNLSRGTNFSSAWFGCNNVGFTSFPSGIDLSSGTSFSATWYGCSNLTSFPALDVSSGTGFIQCWRGLNDMVSFGACTFSTSVNYSLYLAWGECNSMTSFPVIDISKANSCAYAWYACHALTSFPALDISSCTTFWRCWWANNSTVSFGACIMDKGQSFEGAWYQNSSLTTFPAGVFDDWNPASIANYCFKDAWDTCTALTEQSVENILLSISASGQWATSTGTSSGTPLPLAGKEITIDSNNVNVDNLSASNRAACTALQSRGWEVVINGSVVSEYALSFNGTDERVEFSTPTPFSGQTLNTFDCTLSAWAKYDTIAQYEAIICLGAFDLEIAPTSTTEVGIWVDNAAYGGAVYAPTMGVWNHYVATKSGNTYTLYVNGVQIGQNDDADNATVGVTSFIGNNSESNYLDGDIDEVAIWDEALDAAAVLAVYNAGSPINLNRDKGNYDNASDIVSWWRMGDSDSGAGNFVTDVIATDGEALHLPGIAANYASVPDAADLDGFGDFTLEATVALDDWTPAATSFLIVKTLSSSLGYWCAIAATGVIRVYFSSTGGAWHGGYDSTVATGLADGASATIRAVRDGTDMLFYVDGVQLGTSVTCSGNTIFNSTANVELGMREVSQGPLLGKISRARVWSDATQSTNVLDVNFALANKGETSFTATSGQVVTVHSTAIATPAAIRSATDGVLVNAPTFVVDNPPNYSDYSVDFDGTNQYADCGTGLGDALGDNYAGSLTFSMWFKSDDTSVTYRGLFTMGAFAGDYGEVRVSISNNVLAFYLGGLPLPYSPWYRSVAFTDTGWNHVALVYAVGSEANSKMYLNGVATGATTGTFPVAADMDFAGLKTIIGGYYSTSYTFNGLMDEVAIWNSALTSAQINDIYNGGVPAALADSPIGWWRLGENNAGTGITITDQGSGTNNATLYNTPTFSRSVPAEDATWNNRSIEFDGANEYADCGTGTGDALGNNYAGDLTVSMWFKADDTGTDDGVFYMGSFAGAHGVFQIKLHSNNLYGLLGGGTWYREIAFTDTTNWHHYAFVYKSGSESDSKTYLDGVSLGSTGGTFPAASAMDFAGVKTIIGGYYNSSYTFNGNIDEVGVFHSELSASQVLQIYNGGKPASLKEFSPESWWRMGDMDDTGGTTIRDLGVVSTTELVANGHFTSDTTGWTAGTSATLASVEYAGESRLRVTNEASTNHGYAYQEVTVVVGARYKVMATLAHSLGNAVDLQLYLGTSLQGSEYFASGDITADTTITQYITATTTSLFVQCQNSGNAATLAYFDNISVKQDNLVLNGGFDSDTLWTDPSSVWDIAGGKATNDGTSVANTSINQSIAAVSGALYEVTYDWDGDGGHNKTFYVGGNSPGWLGGSDVTGGTAYVRYLGATGAADFKVLTSAGSTGSVDNLSVRQVDGNPATLVNTPTFSTDTP